MENESVCGCENYYTQVGPRLQEWIFAGKRKLKNPIPNRQEIWYDYKYEILAEAGASSGEISQKRLDTSRKGGGEDEKETSSSGFAGGGSPVLERLCLQLT